MFTFFTLPLSPVAQKTPLFPLILRRTLDCPYNIETPIYVISYQLYSVLDAFCCDYLIVIFLKKRENTSKI